MPSSLSTRGSVVRYVWAECVCVCVLSLRNHNGLALPFFSLSFCVSASCVFLPISVFPFMQQLLFCHCFYSLHGLFLIPIPTLLIHSISPLSFSRLCMINLVCGLCGRVLLSVSVCLSVCLTVWGCVVALRLTTHTHTHTPTHAHTHTL